MPVSWSYSRLNTFENCPKRFHHQYVLQDTVEGAPHPAAAWGSQVHEAIEHNIRHGTPLPDNMQEYAVYADLAKQLPNVEAERKLAIDVNWQPTSWKTAWGRAIADVFSVHGDRAIVWDWKTGKYRGPTLQASINALMVFATYPEVNRVDTNFVYFKAKLPEDDVFMREDIPEIAKPVTDVLGRIAQCEARNEWGHKPSGLCGYCPVTSCQFNKT